MSGGWDKLQPLDESTDIDEEEPRESRRWVTREEAARELGISLSTLDRKIRAGEVETEKRGRRVYVLMQGPEYPSDEELLKCTVIKLDESEATVGRLRQEILELEEELIEIRGMASSREEAYEEVQVAYNTEIAMHRRTRRLAFGTGVIATALLVLLIISALITW